MVSDAPLSSIFWGGIFLEKIMIYPWENDGEMMEKMVIYLFFLEKNMIYPWNSEKLVRK